MPQKTARGELILDEYAAGRVARSDLSPADLSRLRSLKIVGVAEKHDHYMLTARTATGVLELSRIRLVLRPKFPIAGKRLIDWLSYANGQNSTIDKELRDWPVGSDGYAGLVPAALLHECRLLLRRGLRRDYVPRQRVGTTLRGRLNVEAQATRCFGTVDQLHLRTFEYEDRTWENFICGSALALAAERVTEPLVKHQLFAVARDFPSFRSPSDVLPLLARAQYSALNAHYRPAHAWARMVLCGGGPDDLLDPYGFGAQGLLLKLDDLWETVVKRMAAEAADSVGGRLVQDSEHYIRTEGRHGDRTPHFLPDALLSFAPPGAAPGSGPYLVVDAKYKNYAENNVSVADRHQLLTYIAGYATPANPLALVIHPDPQGPSTHTLDFRGPRGLVGRILVLGLDTHSTPAAAAEPLRKAITEFAASLPAA
ncbi:5-methylcytosine restriction system specificity protein McrC [Streptomyces sp. DT18]